MPLRSCRVKPKTDRGFSKMAMSLFVSSSESLSLMIMEDSTSLFRKAYLSPEIKVLVQSGVVMAFGLG